MSMRWKRHCEENGIDPKDKDAFKAYHRERKMEGRYNEDGSKNYLTEQHGKDECDINKIIKKYPERLFRSRAAMDEATFEDVTGADFQHYLNTVKNVESAFAQLPVEVRNEYNNSPVEYLNFLGQAGPAKDQINDDLTTQGPTPAPPQEAPTAPENPLRS